MIHYTDEWVTVHHGDCLEVLAEMADNSVDSVVTDPPYGLSNTDPGHVTGALTRWLAGDRSFLPATSGGFMGAAWDSFVPPPAVWDECFRVLKPGGHLLTFAGTRTVDLTGLSVRLAGFEIRDSISWIYSSGFPKALDVSKAIDKARDDRAEILAVTGQIRALRDEAGLTNRELDDLFQFSGMAGHWTTTASQAAVPTVEQWAKLRDVLSPPATLDAEVWRLNGRKGTPGEAWDQRPITQEEREPSRPGDVITFDQRSSAHRERRDIPATDAAQQWQGWATSLKPAHEPVLCARKPMSGTVAQNVTRWGTGALNIAGCRVAASDPLVRPAVSRADNTVLGKGLGVGVQVEPAGRWPANVTFDGPQADALDEQSGTLTSHAGDVRAGATSSSPFRQSVTDFASYADSGGASRFFPVFRYEAKAPQSERPTVNGISHSTVKPLALMRWLVRLVTPPAVSVLVCSVCDEDMPGMRSRVPSEPQRASAVRDSVSPEAGGTIPEDTARTMPSLRGATDGQDPEVLQHEMPGGCGPASTAGLPGLWDDVPTARPGTEVLFEAVRRHGGDAASDSVRVVRQGVPPPVMEGAVLLPGVQCEGVRARQAEGADANGKGLHPAVRTGTPDVDANGLHTGTSKGGSGVRGSNAAPLGSRAPHQRDQGRQPTGESGDPDKAGARQDSEATPETDRVPPLRREDSGFGTCAKCGGDLRQVSKPGTVLEPFAGSGTTVEAALQEGFRCIAIEREADYLPLVMARINKPFDLAFDFEDGESA